MTGSETQDGSGEGLPEIIQGGMGVAVSGCRLARAVAALGQLGVVSGTALDVVLARRLQRGDPTGELRRAIRAFPDPVVGERVLESHLVPGGQGRGMPFANLAMFTAAPTLRRQELAVVGGFVEVFLAKEGHRGPVGINFLEKIQLPTPATLYGALLAGVDYVLVGAGIPRDIPGLLDGLVQHQPVTLPLHVTNAAADDRFELRFDPHEIVAKPLPTLRRPRFLAIVASATLAINLARRAGGVDGFVVEGPTAGGHNAPPRGPLTLADGSPSTARATRSTSRGSASSGCPFWLAGSCATPERLRRARARRRRGHPGGDGLRLLRGVGHRSRAARSRPRRGSQRWSRRLHGPAGFAHRVPLQGGEARRDALRCGRLRGTRAALRPRLPARAVPPARRQRWAIGVRPSPSRTTCARAAGWRTRTAASAFATGWSRRWVSANGAGRGPSRSW